jgi:hypothetical protein
VSVSGWRPLLRGQVCGLSAEHTPHSAHTHTYTHTH